MSKAAPDPEEGSGTSSNHPRRRNHRERPLVPIPSVDQILRQLIELNGAVAIGALSAKEANLIQKTLKTVLDVQLKRSNRESTSPTQEALVDICRRDPRTLNAIQSFLTDEQLESLMDEITEDPDEAV
jgi:hypothetical protein